MVKGLDKWEKEAARFEHKGPGIKKLVRDGERCFDIMENEFRPYVYRGASTAFKTDEHAAACAEMNGSEEEFMAVGRQARDSRLVGTKNGSVARAIGALNDGTGYLVDANGNPIGRTPNAPITPMRRKAEDW